MGQGLPCPRSEGQTTSRGKIPARNIPTSTGWSPPLLASSRKLLAQQSRRRRRHRSVPYAHRSNHHDGNSRHGVSCYPDPIATGCQKYPGSIATDKVPYYPDPRNIPERSAASMGTKTVRKERGEGGREAQKIVRYEPNRYPHEYGVQSRFAYPSLARHAPRNETRRVSCYRRRRTLR